MLHGGFHLGYVDNNQMAKAINLFQDIKTPNKIVTTILFNACAQLGTDQALNLAKQISKDIPQHFHSNSHLSNSLFDALIKCGDCSSAETHFQTMTRSVENYGNLMSGFNLEEKPLKTVKLFNQMKADGVHANMVIYLCVLKALSKVGAYSLSQSIIQQIPDIVLVNSKIQNALIHLWVSSNTLSLTILRCEHVRLGKDWIC